MIKFSVVIPHFNSYESLSKLIYSIPNRNDIEVIVVDDRSTPIVYNQVCKLKSKFRIRIFQNDGVKGAGSCRNIGINCSSGEYLIFADADDFFTKDAFFYIDRALIEADSNYDVYYFKPISENLDGTNGSRHLKYSILVDDYLKNKDQLSEDRLRFTHNVPWSKVIRASLVKANEIFFDETIVANDGMFSAKVGRFSNKIICFNDEIYCVTHTPNSLTTTKNIQNYFIRLSVFSRYYYFLTEHERNLLEISPLPLLYTGKIYGLMGILKSVKYFRSKNIPLFKNFKLTTRKLKLLCK
jgi:glycosyltransferase involved in cell wall biosynthesis